MGTVQILIQNALEIPNLKMPNRAQHFLAKIFLVKEAFCEHGGTLVYTRCQMLLSLFYSVLKLPKLCMNIWLLEIVVFTICEIFTILKVLRSKILSQCYLL